MQKEYSASYKEFLSSKTKGPGEFFRSINNLRICCNHHIMLSTMADLDLEDHEGRRTQDNFSTINQPIADVETCMMSSKIAHLLKSLLKNKQSNCGPCKSAVYSQWTRFLDLIGIVLAHHSILSARIDGTVTARGQEEALEKFFNNHECKVLIASIAAVRTGLNITCTNIVYLMVEGPPEFDPNFTALMSTFPGANRNPAIEAQAVDCLHHIGKQKPVKVIHYITSHSVEVNMWKVPFKLLFVPDCITILKSIFIEIPYSHHQ
ncbi:hypothetical protein O181_085789 [Austropuccinia psidii MF-1]|uniref:Helicase C-terminal domain-containing protein n=1 Tax=Austropuccinia psidii MF-1 TaxID=1389203 RepID=A0A9Q3FVS1_9BASI|nr:hypothetical protein [Austropuccinia psidii MF-1]